MIYDILEVFQKEYEAKGDKLILDNYVLKDGLYVKVNEDNSKTYYICETVKKEKLFKTLDGVLANDMLHWFKERDYYSSILNDDTNKSITSSRYAKILSTNYLSFFFRHSIIFEKINEFLYTKDDITEEILNKLDKTKLKIIKNRMEKRLINFDKLWEIAVKHYYLKLTSTIPKDKKIDFKNTVKTLIEFIKNNNIETDYIKIFFDEDIEEYKKVQRIYWEERIFNKNDFNIIIKNIIYGLSNSNISLSDDKPFKVNKTTKFNVPFRISQMDAILVKQFFDWLENQDINKKDIFKKFNLYINRFMANKKDLGYRKEIKDFDYLPLKIEKLQEPIIIKNYLNIKDKNDFELTELYQLENIVDEVFYNKQLKFNYFNDDLKVSQYVSKNLQTLIFETKYAMVNYFKKYDEREFYQVIRLLAKLIYQHSFLYQS